MTEYALSLACVVPDCCNDQRWMSVERYERGKAFIRNLVEQGEEP